MSAKLSNAKFEIHCKKNYLLDEQERKSLFISIHRLILQHDSYKDGVGEVIKYLDLADEAAFKLTMEIHLQHLWLKQQMQSWCTRSWWITNTHFSVSSYKYPHTSWISHYTKLLQMCGTKGSAVWINHQTSVHGMDEVPLIWNAV